MLLRAADCGASKKPGDMTRSGLPVLVAALLSGAFAATAAAQAGREQTRPPLRPADAKNGALLAGNPLWELPVGELTQTRARPLFSPSRRPPPAPVVALSSPPIERTSARESAPDHPLLTLLGTIVGESVEIGIFADETANDVIRLKSGDVHEGWTLRSARGRVATFEKEGHPTATLTIASLGAEPTALGPGGANPAARVRPAAMTGLPRHHP
jgi:hypothetical protein